MATPSTRTMIALVAGLGGVIALSAGSSSAPRAAPSSTRRRSSAPPKPAKTRSTSAPEGDVTLGPLTVVKTTPEGKTTRATDWASMTTAEQTAYVAAEKRQGRDVELPGSSSELLSEEQQLALEESEVENARAALDGGGGQLERAKRAAQRARELLARKSVAPIPAPIPAKTAAPDDEDDDEDDESDGAAVVASPPTPINLELARREAPTVAKHIRSKGSSYTRQSVRDFQRHAGLVPDGIYGPITASALEYFGASAPKALFRAGKDSPTVYVPNVTT